MSTGTCGGSRKRTRKMRGGNFYGAAGAIAPGAMQWNAVRNAGADSATGLISPPDKYDTYTGGRRRKSRKVSRRRRARRGGVDPESEEVEEPKVEETGSEGEPSTSTPPSGMESEQGGRRRRKSKKAKKAKKSRKVSRRRKMRGGADYLPSTKGVYGFTGAGVARGMGGFEDVSGSNQIPNDVVKLS